MLAHLFSIQMVKRKHFTHAGSFMIQFQIAILIPKVTVQFYDKGQKTLIDMNQLRWLSWRTE